MEPATFLAEPCRDCVDEGRDVVIRLALDLGHALGRRDDGVLANRRRRLALHGPDLRPALECRQLDVQPPA